jgi:HAD superfamily hydrolase (TIGR01509 family)
VSPPAAILDVDGTLVDTNYHHALAWFRALRKHDLVIPLWRIHRHIGMGGDQIVAALCGEEVERTVGDDVRAAEGEEYSSMIDEVQLLPGARELVQELHERGCTIVLASSAKRGEVEHYLQLLDVEDAIDGYTTSADVDRTKPHPDLVQTALAKVGARRAVLVGDTTWDCQAAARAGIETIALLTGGFGADELRAAGARAVFESPEVLLAELGKTPLSA